MAISFVNSAVGSSSPNTGISFALPTLQANDLIIVAAAVGDTANNGLAAPTAPSGFARVPGVAATIYSNDVADCNLDVYYKIAVSGDSGATMTFGAVGGTNASNAAVAMVFRGVDTTTPFDVNATSTSGINTSNADPPSIDHGNPSGVWTVIAGATGHTGTATATFTFPTGYTTNAAQRAHDDGTDILLGMGYNSSPSDPEDPGAFTAANIGTAADNAWAAVTMALRPATLTATRGRVSFAELEVPFVATRGRVSFAELEVPTVATRGRISFAELEVPTVATRGRVSQVEFEVPSLGSPTRGQVSWVELEVPDVQPTRGRISWVELEVPFVPTRGRVSVVELEVPAVATRGRISWVEFQVPTVGDAGGPPAFVHTGRGLHFLMNFFFYGG